jgi:hypothetical protein
LKLGNGISAHRAFQWKKFGMTIFDSSLQVISLIGCSPSRETRITEEVTLLLLTGAPLGFYGHLILGFPADSTSRHFAVPEVLVNSRDG